MPVQAATKRSDPRYRISSENIAAITASAKPTRTPLTAKINLILDAWREDLKTGKKMPKGK